MTIPLRWLVDNSWVFYAVCVIGLIIYLVRALTAQQERRLTMFTLERETATARLVQASMMLLVFIAIGALIFVSTNYILPGLPVLSRNVPLPTPTSVAGIDPPTPIVTPSPTAESLVPTFTPEATLAPEATLPPVPDSEPTATPTPEPTPALAGAIAGELRVVFGDFAELVGYALPSAEVTAAQPVPLTLYWQALDGTSATDLIVFTHLLSENGDLIAQHDSQPANAGRPMTSWVPGESIVDSHALAFQDPTYIGPSRIWVGLYDPDTGRRILAVNGADHVELPIIVNIASQ